MVVALGLASSTGLCRAAPAAAAPTATVPRDPYGPGIGIGLTGGLGAPTGLFGVEAELDVQRWLSISGGAGMAGGGRPQVAGMARLRMPLANQVTALSFGYGLSYGNYYWKEFCYFDAGHCPAEKAGDLWWHNLELGLELREASGRLPVRLRLFGGLAVAGNPHALRCFGGGSSHCLSHHADDGKGPLPYLGVSVGLPIPLR
jgi:hypothetical protein